MILDSKPLTKALSEVKGVKTETEDDMRSLLKDGTVHSAHIPTSKS